MCDAEATHVILFVAMFGVVALEIAAGNRAAAVWIVVFDVMVNGYPVMLQRYNRALLHQRYDDLLAVSTPGASARVRPGEVST